MRFSRIGFPQVLFAPDGQGSGSAPAPSATPSAPAPSGGGETSVPTPSSTPSGASPSPAPSPQPVTPGAASPPPKTPAPGVVPDSAFEFDGLEETDVDLDGLAEPPPPVVAAPAAAPQEPPAPVVPPVQAAQPPGQQPSAPAAGPQEATASLPTPAEPLKMAAALEQNAAALIDHLAQNEFQLSQAEIEALDTDATTAIPKIMARTFVKAQAAALRQMEQVIPAMLKNLSAVAGRNAKNEAKFYSRWPGLNKDQHGELVTRLALTYRQMHPSVPLEQMVEELGPIVMMSAKVPLTAGAAPNGAGTGPGGAPAARPVSPPSPFKPAMPGTPAIPAASPDENPWMGLMGDQSESD